MRLGEHKATLVKVVVFTVASIVLTVALGMRIANVGFFGDTYELEAEFENASGVFEGDAVKLAGVDVGRVTGTRIEDGKAVVSFQVDREVPVTDETQVGIRWRNVIGLRFLYLYPSEGGERLKEGARIPLDRTDEAGDVGEFLNHLGPILRAIDPDKANAFLESMNIALGNNAAVVQGLITDGASLAGELGDMDQDIQSLISSSDRIMAAYASQDDNIGKIVDDLDVLGGELAGMTSEINSLIENFAVVQSQMDRLLTENRANIDGTISNLNSVARTLALKRQDLSRTLCTLPAGVAPYDLTSSWGEWFNVRIVELTFKDEHGRDISKTSEGPRPSTRGTEAFGCGNPDGPGGVAPRGTGEPAATHPRTLERWVESLVGASDG
jgi:phospholipid/cholesterol/gamma-HCH transport system substrate-binding protein